MQFCIIWGSAISKLLNKVFPTVLLGESYTGWWTPEQGEERGRETLHRQRSRKGTSLNKNWLRHGQKSPWCPRETFLRSVSGSVSWSFPRKCGLALTGPYHFSTPTYLIQIFASLPAFRRILNDFQYSTSCYWKPSGNHPFMHTWVNHICESARDAILTSGKKSILKTISICQNLYPL